MHIGLLTTSFPRFEGDVAGSFVLGFARALAARGHTLTVLAPEPSERVAPRDFALVEDAGSTPLSAPPIRTRFVPYVRPRSWARTFYGAGFADNLSDPRAWLGVATFAPALAAAVARELHACDALISHFGVPCGLVAGALRANRPHVAVTHSADVHALERAPWASGLSHALVAGADHVTCVSAAARTRVIALLPPSRRAELAPRVHVQAMGLQTRALQSSVPDRAQAKAGWRLTRFTLLTLARLVPIKGLCEALERIAGRADLEWIIAGDGPLRAQLQRQASRASGRVRLVGEVHGADKRSLLAAADALLLPSRELVSGRAEGTPLCVLEAMAARVPVIASSTGGLCELVDFGRAGTLFDPRSPSAVLEAIDRVRGFTPADRSAQVERGAVIAQAHDWTAVAARYERWLERA